MTDHKERLHAFQELGSFFREFCDIYNKEQSKSSNPQWYGDFVNAIDLAGHKNGWFTKENILFAIQNWGTLLTKENLESWLSFYQLDDNKYKTVALIMAGNIPLVGFHDFLSVLLSGNRVVIKLSSNDAVLFPFIVTYLINIEPSLEDEILIAKGKLENFDAVIATGSNNTSRYFEHYFGHKPNVIRKNRNSVAILTGNESKEQLKALGEDIFRYYGLGCRSVSKLFVPKGYDFDSFFKGIYEFNTIINQTKYANNYDYNKAVYLMSEFEILENGFLMLKEDSNYSSPIASLFYEHYESLSDLKLHLKRDSEKIQCVVANGVFDNEVKFGQTQKPSLTDYADGIDTIEFLLRTT